jgi:hypothetical protein
MYDRLEFLEKAFASTGNDFLISVAEQRDDVAQLVTFILFCRHSFAMGYSKSCCEKGLPEEIPERI